MILDWNLDLYGPLFKTSLSTVQALVLVWGAAAYAAWVASLGRAAQGSRHALMANKGLCAFSGLGNGLAIIFCLPPCSSAALFGDISHIGSLVFGAWGIAESWRALRQGASLKGAP
ncbi:MAG: hypothetical protein SFU83_08830 [Meiothermus sp.]|nr:hypothetical protein [Meiothermus sp.]